MTYDSDNNLTSKSVNPYTWEQANCLLSTGGIAYQHDGMGNIVLPTRPESVVM